jgi:hypothetical protein
MFGLGATASYAPSHWSQGAGMTMTVTTDIGPGIPHFGVPSLTLPLVILFSASKSYFGPAAHQAEGKPIAVALVINLNPNLNCSEPVPLPFGSVIALNTHYVGMTFADFLGGLCEGISDFLIQAVLQFIGDRAGGRLTNWLNNRFFQRIFQNNILTELFRTRGDYGLAAANAGLRAAMALEQRLLGHNVAGSAFATVLGFFVGGPMGVDAGTLGGPTAVGAVQEHGLGLGENSPSTGRRIGEALGGPIDDYLNSPDPNIGDYPTPSGDSSAA